MRSVARGVIAGETSAAFAIALTGLTAGEAVIGDHASIGYTIDPDNGTETVKWSNSSNPADAATYGTGASPTDFTAGDGTPLYLHVTDGGETVTRSAPIRYAAGTAPSVGAQAWTVDDTAVSLDGSASGANLTFSYVLSGSAAGVAINPASGLITGTPTAVSSGTATITATDQYGRTLQDTFTWTASLRAQATAAGGLANPDWTVDDDAVSIDTKPDFTANGNTLGYVITGLPTGLADDGDGTLSGTPTVNGQSGTVTITATDEYGRETVSTFTFTTAYRTQATGGADLDLAFPEDSAITPTDLVQNWTTNGNTLTFDSVSPSLPAGLSINSAGVLSGTPTDVTADAQYTLTMLDEYGRSTADTFNLEITVVASDPAEFTIVMRTTGASETVTLPMAGNNNLDIDWGDGSPVDTGVTADDPSHVYATADDYTIKVTGTTDALRFDGSGEESKVIEVVAGGTSFTPGSLLFAFRDCTNMTSADISAMNISGNTLAVGLFYNCASATSLSVAGMAFGNVDMQQMFFSCTSATSIDVSGMDTSSVKRLDGFFQGCSLVTSLDVSNWDTSTATRFNNMFNGCTSLTSVDVSGFDTSNGATWLSQMFRGAESLTSVDVSGFTVAGNIAAMLSDCIALEGGAGVVSWDVTGITSGAQFADGSDLLFTTAEYDAVLVAWEAQAVQDNVSIHFGDATYTSGSAADTARTALANDHNWTIVDGGSV